MSAQAAWRVADDGSRWRSPDNPTRLSCRLEEWVRRLGASLTDAYDCIMGMGHVWTAPGCQGFSHVAAVVGAAMCPAFKRLTWPLAIMPSADQVPVKSAHSTMRWPKWVVLITGSTRSALRAVGPLQPFRHATTARSCSSSPSLSLAPRAIARERPALCSSLLSPSSPMPSWRSCWPALWPRPSSACARVAWSATADAWCHAFAHIE